MRLHKLSLICLFAFIPSIGKCAYKSVINPYTGQPDLVGISTTTTLITNLTGSKVLVSSGSGAVAESGVSTTTLSYLDTTSSIQGQINGKLNTANPSYTGTMTSPLTASLALVTDSTNHISTSATTSTELGYVSGVTSGIQAQINGKAPLASPVFTGTPTADAFIINTATFTKESVKREITMTVDGANAVITTGKHDLGVRVPSNMTLTGWEIKSYPQTAAGTLKVDVWYKAFGSFPTQADSIVGSSTPTLTSSYISSGTVSGLTTTSLAEQGSIDLNFQTVTVTTHTVFTLFGTTP